MEIIEGLGEILFRIRLEWKPAGQPVRIPCRDVEAVQTLRLFINLHEGRGMGKQFGARIEERVAENPSAARSGSFIEDLAGRDGVLNECPRFFQFCELPRDIGEDVHAFRQLPGQIEFPEPVEESLLRIIDNDEVDVAFLEPNRMIRWGLNRANAFQTPSRISVSVRACAAMRESCRPTGLLSIRSVTVNRFLSGGRWQRHHGGVWISGTAA